VPDRRNPIANRMRERIVSGLHLGTLAPGSRLPSIRDLSVEFHVAPRTIMAVYRLLEAEGLVELRKRSGIYVASGGPGATPMLSHLAGWVVEVLLDAQAREIPPIAFPERVRRCLETLRLRAVCIAGNADQMDEICHELHDDYGIESEGLFFEDFLSPDVEAQRLLARSDLLITTSFYTAPVHHAARTMGKTAITVTLRPELMGEITRNLAKGPVYLIGTDPRFRQAVQIVFDPTGFGSNMHVLILGEDDLDSLSPDAPAYIMRRAHVQLGDSPLTRRVVPIHRVFSSQMSRELLTFIVRANITAMAARGG
jgi:DNA-binding transcriptional regulator YhcF (GntR family)